MLLYCMHKFIDSHVGGTEFAEYIIGASLSEPHINGLYGAGPSAMVYCVYAGIYMSILASGVPGATLCSLWWKWLPLHFKFFQRSASNDHYIAQNNNNSPTLATIKHTLRSWEAEWLLQLYIQCICCNQDTHQRGWLKHAIRCSHFLLLITAAAASAYAMLS